MSNELDVFTRSIELLNSYTKIRIYSLNGVSIVLRVEFNGATFSYEQSDCNSWRWYAKNVIFKIKRMNCFSVLIVVELVAVAMAETEFQVTLKQILLNKKKRCDMPERLFTYLFKTLVVKSLN